MYHEHELKSFAIIDKFLTDLVEGKTCTILDIGNDFNSPNSQMAYKIMCDNDLIIFRKGYPDKSSIIDIAPNGLTILKIGGYQNYLTKSQEVSAEKERLDLQY